MYHPHITMALLTMENSFSNTISFWGEQKLSQLPKECTKAYY